MAYADPQTITVNSVAKSLALISSTPTSSTYQNIDETFKLTISHQKSGTRTRSMVRVDQRAVVTNPLDSTNDYDTCSFFCVLDHPEYGFSNAQQQQLVAALQAWLDGASVLKLIGKEH
jgi:hypothetical protein